MRKDPRLGVSQHGGSLMRGSRYGVQQDSSEDRIRQSA